MNNKRQDLIKEYYNNIKKASLENVKRAIFQNLLNSLFLNKGDDAAKRIIEQFAAGTEHAVRHIQREGKRTDRGRADTQYGTVLIEFENDLAKTGDLAIDQLRDYVSDNWNSKIQTRFTLIATDCLEWRVYALDYGSLIKLGETNLAAEDLHLDLIDRFEVSPENADDFYYFLDRYLFKSEIQQATSDGIRRVFGAGSDIFQAAIYLLHKAYAQIKDNAEIQPAYEQWRRFLSIAYGRFEASESIFMIQSYLSILAKMLAYEVITAENFIAEDELKSILDGSAFRRRNIANFTSDDFFRWTTFPQNWPILKEVLRMIASGLSQFDFNNVQEDILKGLYQELVDDDTKHKLGEYYTPDWLCACIVEELAPQPGQKLLDPSCGSGSFLKAAANYLVKMHPDISASELNSSLYGIDVHPLSVQIAKATLLMAFGKKRLQAEAEPINLNIFLANTLLLPDENTQASLLGRFYAIYVDDKKIELPVEIFTDISFFYRFVGACKKLAEDDARNQTSSDESAITVLLANILGKRKKTVLKSGYQLYKALLRTILAKRDSIWAYIISNSYIVLFLQHRFDFIAGNPPWLTFKDLASGDYQDKIKKVAELYNILPQKTNMHTQLELAAIFLGHTINYFLKPQGKLAFVLPRCFFNGEQHHNTRAGKTKDVKISQIWDLSKEINPFKIPSCVIFAQPEKDKTEQSEIPCKILFPDPEKTGNQPLMREDKVYLSQLGDKTAWTIGEKINFCGQNPYYDKFINGATLFPRSCCFVVIDQDYSGSLLNRIFQIKSCEDTYRDAKAPWKNVKLKGEINSKFLFSTALSNNIVPFGLNGSFIVALPCAIKNQKLEMLSPEEVKMAGYLDSSCWFREANSQWEINRTDKNKKIDFASYLNWMHKLTVQNIKSNFIVLYTSSGSNAVYTIISRGDSELIFIAENATYAYFTDNKDEACYLSAIFNSPYINNIITPFQIQGLMGPRNIHKKILSVPFPTFNQKNANHLQLARIAEKAAAKVKTFLAAKNLGEHGGNLNATETGRLRNQVREYLEAELKQIDQIISSGFGHHLESELFV